MISKNDVLNLKTRREIYDLIVVNPGLHLREISRRANMSFGGLRYHLDFLLKKGLVITRSNSGYTRYYAPQKIGKEDQELLDILRQEIPRRIILLLLIPGPGDIYINKDVKKEAFKNPDSHTKTYSKKELIELTKHWKGPNSHLFRLNRHPTTIESHLEKLLDIGIIEKYRVGKEYKYKLKVETDMWLFLIKYQNALSDKTIDLFLSCWLPNGDEHERAENGILNLIEEIFYEVFPHPYHC
jgi:predicted transcriptional regulator